MKGNSEFAYFLLTGLVILAVLLAIFGVTLNKPVPGNKTQQGVIEAIKTFTIPSVSASDVLSVQTSGMQSRWVQNGLLFGEEKITYDLIKSGVQDAAINFRVTSSNGLGKLRVAVNGQIIENRFFDPGDYSIRIDNSLLSNRNHIEIAAESSLWKIWAPNLYKITNANIVYTSFEKDFSQYKFYLGEEYLNLEFAKVDIVLEENVGTMIVELNGREIWKSPVGNLQSITFDMADLRLGDNVIAFKADKDSRFSGRGTIAVIFLTRFPETINQTGTVTAVQPVTGFSNQFYT